MALPACAICGRTNPRKMVGLMTQWFGPFVDMLPDHGYFYLCPTCYHDRIKPHLDAVQNKLYELHPLAHRLGLRIDLADAEPREIEQGEGEDGEEGSDPGPATRGAARVAVAVGLSGGSEGSPPGSRRRVPRRP